ncbi:hypothetical protein FOZ76_02720 [Verticiella sediminum]|uniref:Uncharacterized protein n=1 Tax=Verticiella sediminum TaxID=1247510 RepID=A0A556B0F9_9BURK|nr:hypothetical protein [Verticiella sediminum]TSH98677.1 hypothetical protein FOZ76_02720 [Verticiella sediminum]
MFILEIHRAGEFVEHVGWFDGRAQALAVAPSVQREGELVLVHPDGREERLSALSTGLPAQSAQATGTWQHAA